MVEFVIEELASGQSFRVARLVRALARKWPGEKALMISFALTNAASELEDLVSGDSSAASAERAYRLAALVAGDVLAIEAMGRDVVLGRDLLHYWRRVDPYFLNLKH
ncbi:hypothetical protein [Aestuariibius sp. HNIBRBA575]|uniref:hypothetical protein n=1 Tax=Aestuariibius sp. HNIBRBA575 TaxID=3233343 RepID=UPI0034A13974